MGRPKTFLFIGIIVFFCQCSGQSTQQDAKKLATDIKEKMKPGEVPPGAGIYMKATIDGKPWTASNLIPDRSTGSNDYRVTGTADETTIGFYIYMPHIKVGSVEKFSENHAADFITHDEHAFYGARTGKFVITKLDEEGFEGTFFFTATSSSSTKKFEVTNGVLRFPWAKR